ncbi:ABC transporter substrate-binding protein [Plastoroseomonas hellenica]|uniref:Extracellular solute-binding protein n=1 Tax=Plastoroseomonas hellenica TaxID=2687306 RepID=A0ABS5F9Q3_9PROT|nr:extracellular solute-binding protein [Plastoroseomonas hellenica]MBR0647172.1 extracellular solute-binding protein [Plastoroseomonas hellenica]MBR0668820.1 extracellular solute-binding protein [Plastoroseomonas hellenica]
MTKFTRRKTLGLSAAAIAAMAMAEKAQAQASAIPVADATAPNLPIERGATLRMLRPVRFVQPDEDTFRANCARFTQQTGVEVRVDFVGWEDITQQTAVTANTGAGPDLIIGFNESPHVYVDKLVELTDVAEYIGKRYGGWLALAQKYGKRHGTNNWIGLPFGASGGPLVWRKSAVNAVGFERPPEDHAGYLDLCRKLKQAGKPAGFALGNAVGDGNGFANWVVWSHNGFLVNEDGSVGVNSRETVAALTYLKDLYATFIPGTLSWGDVSNNRAYASNECWLTANGVSLYFALKNDPATRAIAEDSEHMLLPKGLASSSPMAGLTLNAMVFKHSRFPNASKALLQFLLEREQYDPWLQANLGYWAQPLEAYGQSAVWNSDPKVSIFRDTMKNPYWIGYKGPISEASAQANAEYIMVQMCASVASGQATPEQAAREAERRAQRIFRRR